MRYIVKSFIRVLIKIIIIFIKQKNIIILSSFNLMSYRTNTRYLYEYLSKNLHNYNIYYVTESRNIKEYFDKNNLKYISKNNIFKFLYVSASAKIVINSGDAYHNPLNITDTKNIIKICTMHGNSPKTRLPRNIKAKESGYHKFDYVCFNNDFVRLYWRYICFRWESLYIFIFNSNNLSALSFLYRWIYLEIFR